MQTEPYRSPDTTDDFPRLDTPTRVQPVFVFGDSHALGFRDTVILDRATGRTVATRVHYCSETPCTAETFFSEPGGFHTEIVVALKHEGLLRGGRAAHLSLDPTDLKIGYATGLPQVAPPILLTCGDIDVRAWFLHHLEDERDFVLPGDRVYPTADVPLTPYDVCRRMLDERVTALMKGVHRLQGIGFSRTAVLGIAPPTTDDELFERVHGYRCPVGTRYKAAVLFNHLLADKCRASGVHFVDVWPDVTRDGYLLPEFELDGVHLAPEAVRHCLRRLLHNAGRESSAVNYRRYELLYQLARGLEPSAAPLPAIPEPLPPAPPPPAARRLVSSCKRMLKRVLPPSMHSRLRFLAPSRPIPATESEPASIVSDVARSDVPQITSPVAWVREVASAYHRDGLCRIALGRPLAERWLSLLDFANSVGNRHVSFDWFGNPIKPISEKIRYGEPPQELLDEIRELLDAEAFADFFHATLGGPIDVLSCRPLLSLPHEGEGTGPQSFHRDGCPAGLIRGIVYLTDVGPESGPFEYRDDSGSTHTVTAPAGTLLVFDANRLLHRGSPPRSAIRKVIDMVIAPRLPGQSLRVIAPGMNNWPNDPFRYSLAGMKASPPTDAVALPPYDTAGHAAVRPNSARRLVAVS